MDNIIAFPHRSATGLWPLVCRHAAYKYPTEKNEALAAAFTDILRVAVLRAHNLTPPKNFVLGQQKMRALIIAHYGEKLFWQSPEALWQAAEAHIVTARQRTAIEHEIALWQQQKQTAQRPAAQPRKTAAKNSLR